MGNTSGKHTTFGCCHDSVKFILGKLYCHCQGFLQNIPLTFKRFKIFKQPGKSLLIWGKILSGEQITFPFIFSSRLSQHEVQVEKIWTFNSLQKTPELLR